MVAVAEVAGVDAFRGGWVAVVLRDGAFAGAVAGRRFREVLAAMPAGAVVAVDIPIGLLERGWRRADAEAQRFLGRRAASVFRTPPRAVVEAGTPAEAHELCQALTGEKLSPFALNLAPRILEVEACRDEAGARLYEVHPEVSFQALAGQGLAAGKKTWAGMVERRRLLKGAGIVLPDDLGTAGVAAVDDVLDAAVAAWSATRIAAGTAACLPDPPERDTDSRPVAIWY
jgi:predicted RNase H-like nuclease